MANVISLLIFTSIQLIVMTKLKAITIDTSSKN